MFCNTKDGTGLVVGAAERTGIQVAKDRAGGLPALRHSISAQLKKAGVEGASGRDLLHRNVANRERRAGFEYRRGCGGVEEIRGTLSDDGRTAIRFEEDRCLL